MQGGGGYRSCLVLLVVFFFFQAEDGIRDYKVTGVQTCALPIYPVSLAWAVALFVLLDVLELLVADLSRGVFADGLEHADDVQVPAFPPAGQDRSEERRVGKSVDLGGRRIIKKKKKRE